MKIMSMLLVASMMMASTGSFAATANLSAEQLRARIVSEEKVLAEMKTAIRGARSDGNVMAIHFTKHLAKFVLIGYGTTKFYQAANLQGSDLLDKGWNYLTNQNKGGNDPFTKAANSLAKIDPRNGVIVGPLPRELARDGAMVVAKGVGLGTMVGGVVWSGVEAIYTVGDGIVAVADYTKVVALEAAIQVAQERLTSALANLSAVQH